MPACKLCTSNRLINLIDGGPQPISNRFLIRVSDQEDLFPLGLSQCCDCGLLQLAHPVAPSQLVPRYDWITYHEAEGHLDRLVDEILHACDLAPEATLCGVSYKDASTVQRLKNKGFRHTFIIDPRSDLEMGAPGAGIETIQDRFDERRARILAAHHGPADLIIARHILEHAHDLHRFTLALKALLKPNGYLVIEVPDFSISLAQCDYATLWEEHISYFTPPSFSLAVARLGFTSLTILNYPYTLENSLVAITRNEGGNTSGSRPVVSTPDEELQKGRTYGRWFLPTRMRLADKLAAYRRQHGSIAIFGAGHLATKFINLMNLKEFMTFVVDDHPKKMGLFMPGSHLPIVGSSALITHGIRLCLLSLNPESETKVITNNQAFIKQGGQFASIFPASPRALT